MPRYQFDCACGSKFFHYEVDDPRRNELKICEVCNQPLRRRWGFVMGRVIHAHYNPFIGKEVSSMRQIDDYAKLQSEIATAKTGIEHDYRPVPLEELKPRDDSALRSTYDAAAKDRRPPIPKEALKMISR